MKIELEGRKFVKVGDKRPAEQLLELVEEEGRKVKLSMPFLADGFKSEKQPLQPDGVTPIVVESANLKVEKYSKLTEVKEPEESVLYTKQELEKLSLKELKEIGKKFGTTDRSKNNLIREILKIQKE